MDIDSLRLKALGNILRYAREGLRFSYRELAEISGISASQILRMESGEFDYALTKFLRVSEALGLSVGIVLESAMFRSFPRPELSHVDISPIEEWVQRHCADSNKTYSVKAEMALEDKVLSIREFVMSLAEIVASLILASNPGAMSSHLTHRFTPVNDNIAQFGNTIAHVSFHHAERATALKALFDNPFLKLVSLGIINDTILSEYLQWSEKHKLGASLPLSNTWAAAHVQRPPPKRKK